MPDPQQVPEIAQGVRAAWGVPPEDKVNLDRVCRNLDIEVAAVELGVPEGGAQGFLVPKSTGGFRIEVDPEPRGGWRSVSSRLRRQLNRHRQRFLIVHELAHTLFYEDGPGKPRRVVFDSPRQEEFCDELARALLVPPEAVAELPFEPNSVIELQRRFDVSVELATRALAAAHQGLGITWLLVHRHGRTLVQWASVEQELTCRAFGSLAALAALAANDGEVETVLDGLESKARACHLPDRDQVIVTSPQDGCLA